MIIETFLVLAGFGAIVKMGLSDAAKTSTVTGYEEEHCEMLRKLMLERCDPELEKYLKEKRNYKSAQIGIYRRIEAYKREGGYFTKTHPIIWEPVRDNMMYFCPLTTKRRDKSSQLAARDNEVRFLRLAMHTYGKQMLAEVLAPRAKDFRLYACFSPSTMLKGYHYKDREFEFPPSTILPEVELYDYDGSVTRPYPLVLHRPPQYREGNG